MQHGVIRQAGMSGIVKMEGGKRVIALAKIRGDRLVRVENFHAIVQAVDLSVIGVNQKIRTIGDADVKAFAQKFVKEIFVFVVRPKIAEIDSNPSLHLEVVRSKFFDSDSCFKVF